MRLASAPVICATCTAADPTSPAAEVIKTLWEKRSANYLWHGPANEFADQVGTHHSGSEMRSVDQGVNGDAVGEGGAGGLLEGLFVWSDEAQLLGNNVARR